MLRRLLPPTTGVGAALLVVCVTIVLTACTTPSPRLDPEPASIAWHATDFRIIHFAEKQWANHHDICAVMK